MAAHRISMRKINDILRLFHQAKLSQRRIARALSVSRDTVATTISRAAEAGLSWPLPQDLNQADLELLLYQRSAPPPRGVRPLPDWAEVHRELKAKGVTLQLLWQEYKMQHPEGYQYSWFCDLYRTWRSKLDLVMRQDHRAGEKLFIDYAGQTIPVTDPDTMQVRQAQLFVAVLGCSNYTFAEATFSQTLPDWIGSHQRAFHFLGGVPEIVVPDNLKSGVTKAHRYEPDLNPTYQDLAQHYGVAVLPARVRRPRDKAKVEAGVLLVERWILACLRKQVFFSLAALNEAIAHLLERLNERPFQKLEGSRKSLFISLERPVLRPLPPTPYVYAQWQKRRVGVDYHVEVDRHYYSVPYHYARQQIEVRMTEQTIECFLRGERIASHQRSYRAGRHTTVKAHMPPSHRHYADWTPERLIDWAAQTGEATSALIRHVIAARAHPQQGYRSALGILRLGEVHGQERLETAAQRALAIGATSYKSVASILKHGLEASPLPGQKAEVPPLQHDNLRGPQYYTDSREQVAVKALDPIGSGPTGSGSTGDTHIIHPNPRYEC